MVFLRKALYSDIDLLYEWANDPAVRQNSFQTDFIPYEIHQKWFERIMHDENVIQYILISDSEPVGQIRLTVHGDEAEISYSVASLHRGRGFGRIMIQLIGKEVSQDYPQIKRLIAKVKPENAASKILFESENYKLEYQCYSFEVPKGDQ